MSLESRRRVADGAPVERSEQGEDGQAQTSDDHEYREGAFARMLAGNLRSLGLAQVASRVAGFAVVILLARELGRADFGRYTVGVGVAAILGLLIQLGMGGYIVREGARVPEALSRILGHVLILRAGLGAVAVAVAIGFGLLSGYDRATLVVVAVLTLAGVLSVLAASYEAVLLALERARDAAVIKAGREIGLALAAALAVLLGYSVIGVSIAVAAIALLTLPWAWRRLRRRWSDRLDLRLSGLRTTLAVSAAFAASQGMHRILTYLDSVMVHAFRGNVETGLYGAAYRVLLGLTLVPAIYVDATTRMISRLAATDRERMAEVYARAVAHLSMFGTALGAGGAILAGPILDLLYDESYVTASGALSILLVSATFAIPVWVTAMTCYALNLQNRVVIIWAIALAGNALVNLYAIPAFGIEGAATATLGSEIFAMVLMTLLLRRSNVRANLVRTFGKPLVAGAVMCAAIWPLRDVALPVPIAVGAIVFVGCLVLLRAFGPEDRRLLLALVGRRAEPANEADA